MPNQFVARGRQRSVLTRKGSSDARACGRFFAWCDGRGLTLTTIRPFDVATYIESQLQNWDGAVNYWVLRADF
jgi:hypothetical protein